MRTPAFLIAATKSGAGKTTLTLGIMAALVRRGYRVQPFKCGPDFIDPSLHRFATGVHSYNIDLQMMGALGCLAIVELKAADADILVFEGVMGLFDGGPASTAEIAKALAVPVFLIVDASSSAQSNAAVLKGFEEFDPQVRIAGVIFNRIGSPRHRELIELAVRDHCRTPIVGWIPRDDTFAIGQRHLGLHMGTERPLGDEALDQLVGTIEDNLDLTMMIEGGMHEAPALSRSGKSKTTVADRRTLRIGLADDQAFCFYYRQNLELFEAAGFEIVRFSPLQDRMLPPGLQMLYFGGGYPEMHAATLSANREMLAQVRAHHEAGVPIYGECGGFMYLCQQLIDQDGRPHRMVGIFPFRTKMGHRLRRLGYRCVKILEDCLLGRRGQRLYGHEFHYSDIDPETAEQEGINGVASSYRLDNNSLEGYSVGSALGSYIHLHFAHTPEVFSHLRRHLCRRV